VRVRAETQIPSERLTHGISLSEGEGGNTHTLGKTHTHDTRIPSIGFRWSIFLTVLVIIAVLSGKYMKKY
jgi:hypothetical protein